jgi:hypothetical protein
MTSGIIEILIEDINVQALVGQDHRGQYKVYPTVAPEKTPGNTVDGPYVIVSEASLNPTISKGCPSTLDFPRYEVLVYSTDFRETELIQEACRVCLDNGQDWSTETVDFDSIWMVDRRDLYAQGTGQGMYVKAGTYEAAAKRTIA